MSQAIPILLVEDNEIDVQVVQRNLKKINVQNPLHTASDGVEALEILYGKNGREKLSQPCLILLDINMPRMNGFEFLTEIRRDKEMNKNIVLMLTTSARSDDVASAYKLNASGYFLKENTQELLGILDHYCRFNQFEDIKENPPA
jgi:CheY-like chemotaxis protein